MKKSFGELLYRHRFFIIPFLVLIIICFIILLINTKLDLFLWINNHHNHFFDRFFMLVTMIGDGLTTVIVVLGMLFLKYRYSVLTAMAYAYSSFVVQVLKLVFNSPRPSKFFQDLFPIRTIEDYPLYEWKSFPSGHSASAFTLAVVLAYLLPYKHRQWIIIPVAAITAFSRVYLAQHFLEDIVAGAILGVVLTFQLIWWLENSHWYHSPILNGRLFGKV